MSKPKQLIDLYGDMHNHCNISYAHGGLVDALENALLRLDFVSITGHADWPDMDTNDPRISHIVDFHQKGFAKLKRGWDAYLATMAAYADRICTLPGYEIHSNEHGDYTIVGRDKELEITLADSPGELRSVFEDRYGAGTGSPAPPVLLFPHHIGYRRGARGVNWESFSPEFSPLVEIYSMHGLNDADDSDKEPLHSMGPRQSYGTMVHGLNAGNWFGVVGNSDHHSGHPGSYGHGMTGVWAADRERESIWQALFDRRTWAMTGDKVRLWFSLGGAELGGEARLLSAAGRAEAPQPGSGAAAEAPFGWIAVDASAAIDYVELVVNGRRSRLWWRPVAEPGEEAGVARGAEGASPGRGGAVGGQPGNKAESPLPPALTIDTRADEAIFALELGWGERGKPAEWTVDVSVEGGEILEHFPRFRGPEVVSPLDKSGAEIPTHNSHIDSHSLDHLRFRTTTWGNITNSTPSTQGYAFRVTHPEKAVVSVRMNDVTERRTVAELLSGSISGNLGPIDSPAYRMSAIRPQSYRRLIPVMPSDIDAGYAYVRVRLKNGHWAISSPIRLVG